MPWLYRRFHKPHHRLTAPFAWGSHAVHPVEMLLQSGGAMAGPATWSCLYGGIPVHAWWVWLCVIQMQGVMDHSGFELPPPFDVWAMLPGFGGTKFHDEHHQSATRSSAPGANDSVHGVLTPRPQVLQRELRGGNLGTRRHLRHAHQGGPQPHPRESPAVA